MKLPDIRAIVADDVVETLNAVCDRITILAPNINIVKRCSSIKQITEAIDEDVPDVLITDIRFAPESKTIFDLLDLYKNIPSVNFSVIIFTGHYNETAYLQKSYGYPNTLHFIPKPIDSDMLQEALNRVAQFKSMASLNVNNGKFSLSTIKGTYFIDLDELVYIKSQNGCTEFHVKMSQDKTTVYRSSRNIGYFDEVITDNKRFFRIHDSIILNLDYMIGIGKKSFREVILLEPFGTLTASKVGFKMLMETFKY